MTRTIALTQFIIVSLGTFAVHLLVKVGGQEKNPRHIDDVAQFIARHALWFFAVPILYAVCTNVFRGGAEALPFKIAGFVLCAILLVLFGIPLHYYLN
jgi:uncharacterized membrane protein YgdD (TMEM256/DUF423 family)